MPEESSFAEEFIDRIVPEDEATLRVVKALPPGEVEGIIESGTAQGFQLLLSRKAHRDEIVAIENNDFGFPMRVQGKNIFVTGSIEKFANVSIDFNSYVKDVSEIAVAKVQTERAQSKEAEKLRQQRNKELGEIARNMKFE